MFLFLPPNKSEFCTAEMSSLIRSCNGWTKADFSETRASGLMSFLTVWALPWSICSLASCGGGGVGGCHCQQVCQLSNCQDIQFTWAWIFFLGNANTIEPFQQLFGAVFPRQSMAQRVLYSIEETLLETREETFCQEFQHSVSVFIGFYIWNSKRLLKRHAVEAAVCLCGTSTSNLINKQLSKWCW